MKADTESVIPAPEALPPTEAFTRVRPSKHERYGDQSLNFSPWSHTSYPSVPSDSAQRRGEACTRGPAGCHPPPPPPRILPGEHAYVSVLPPKTPGLFPVCICCLQAVIPVVAAPELRSEQ